MLLHRLRLKNFKRFREAEIAFRDGITGIVGNNGAGKSTIVEAILFALYGVKSSGIEGEFVVSSLAPPKERCEVRLDFRAGGHDYSVLRMFKKGKASVQHDAELYLEGSLLAGGVAPVEREVNRVLGMGPVDFRNTIYAGQKDLLSLLDGTPGERQKWFMRVLGIDFLKKESDAILKSEIEGHLIELQGYENRLSDFDRDEISSGIEECRTRRENAERDVMEMEGLKEGVIHDIRKLEERIEDMRLRRERISRLGERCRAEREKLQDNCRGLERFESERSALEQYRDEFRALSSAEDQYGEVKRQHDEMTGKKEAYDDLSAQQRNILVLAKQDSELGQRYETALKRRDADRVEVERLERELNGREERIAEYDALVRNEGAYLELWRAQSLIEARYGEIEEKVTGLRAEIEYSEKTLEKGRKLKALEATLQSREGEKETVVGRISALAQQASDAGNELGKIDAGIGELKETGREGNCPTCRRPLGDQYPRLMEELTRRRQDLVEFAEKCRSELEEFAGKKVAVEQSVAELKLLVRQAAEEMAGLEQRYEERRKLQKEAEACLLKRMEGEERLAALNFNPERKRDLQSMLRRSDEIWREYLQVRERLRAAADMERERALIAERIAERSVRAAEIDQAIQLLGFDAGRFAGLRTLLQETEGAYKRYIELKARMEGLPSLEKSIAEKQRAVEDSKAAIERLAAEISACGYSREQLSALESDLAGKRAEHDRIVQALSDKKSLIDRYGEELARLIKQEAAREEYEYRCTSLRHEIALLRQTRRLLGEYVSYLLMVVRDRIEGEVGRVLGEITDGRYENVLIDDDFTVLVNDMGENFPAYRFSGGEQDDIAIALRIALSRYLAEMHRVSDSTFLIFDEIFGSQDEERRTNLIKALRTQEVHFPQIFLISHITDIQGEFSNTLQVDMGADTGSRVQELSP
jgi:exonuclease SbcC